MVVAAAIADMLVAATAAPVAVATAEDKPPIVVAVAQRVAHQETSASTHTHSGSQHIALCLRRATARRLDRV